MTVRRLLTVAGIEPAEGLTSVALGVDEAVAALGEGRIAAFFFSGGLPVTALAELAAATSIRLLPLGQYVPALRRHFGKVYVERSIPASTYSTDPVTTVAVPNYLVAPAALSERTAYALTRILMERQALV